MNRLMYATSTAALVLLGACAGNGQNATANRPKVAGSWTLNEKDSQNPLTLIGGGAGGFGTGRRGGTTGDPVEGGGRRGGGGFGGGRSGGGRGAPSGMAANARAKAAAAEQKLEVLADMQKRLRIRDDGKSLTIGYAIGPEMRYFTRGKMTDTVPVLGVVRSQATWKDTELVINQKIGQLETKEEFTRNPGSNRLVVYTSVKGLERPMQYRRVYDLE